MKFQNIKESKDASEARKQLEVMWAYIRHEEVHARKHQGNDDDDLYTIYVDSV